MSKKTSRLLGTSTVARTLECSEDRARRLLDAGAIPSQRDAAGRRLANEADVLRFKKQRARKEQRA